MSDTSHSAEQHHDPFEVQPAGFPTAADSERLAARDQLEVVVTRFTDEVRQGGFPSVEQYADQYPRLADELRELLPLVQSLEQWGINKEAECVRSNFPEDFSLRDFGEYRIVREIGRGGMGIVFEALHEESSRAVAIKLLPFRLLTDLTRRQEQFRREATTIAALRHSNIVSVYSFGSHRGYCYYVMQLVDGVSLDVVLRRLRESAGPVYLDAIVPRHSVPLPASPEGQPAARVSLSRNSWKLFARLGEQVARALHYAHEHGIRHNDVKPANLLLERTGRVIVTDFGVGLRLLDDLTDGREHPAGTLRYMAPERFGQQCDARSDVYSLGATLYEMLTQTPMYVATDRRALIDQVLHAPPRSPRDINPDVPMPLELIVLKALSKTPEQRFESAEELADELSRFANGLPIRTRRLGPLRRFFARLRVRRSRTDSRK